MVGRGRGRKPGRPKRSVPSQADQAQSDRSWTGPSEQGASASPNTTTLNITPKQYDGGTAGFKSEVPLEGDTQGIDIREVETISHHRRYIYQHKTVLMGITLAVIVYFTVEWIEKRTGCYLYTNYRDVGVWTNAVQEQIGWAVIGALVVWYFTQSFQKMLMSGLILFILQRGLSRATEGLRR